MKNKAGMRAANYLGEIKRKHEYKKKRKQIGQNGLKTMQRSWEM